MNLKKRRRVNLTCFSPLPDSIYPTYTKDQKECYLNRGYRDISDKWCYSTGSTQSTHTQYLQDTKIVKNK